METVVQGYNKIVAPFASNKNHMFIQRTLNILHELLKQVGAIRKGLIKLINQLVYWIATADFNMINIVVFHFVRSIRKSTRLFEQYQKSIGFGSFFFRTSPK